MGWAIFLVLIIIYKVTGRKQPGGKGENKTKLIIGIIRETLLFAAVCALVFAPLPFGLGSVGTAVGSLLLTVFGWLGSLVNLSGTTVATVLLIAAVVVAVWDIVSDLNVDRPAKNALIVMPFLCLIAVGPIASGVQNVVGGIQGTATNSVSNVLGQ